MSILLCSEISSMLPEDDNDELHHFEEDDMFHLGSWDSGNLNKILSGRIMLAHCDGGYNEYVGKYSQIQHTVFWKQFMRVADNVDLLETIELGDGMIIQLDITNDNLTIIKCPDEITDFDTFKSILFSLNHNYPDEFGVCTATCFSQVTNSRLLADEFVRLEYDIFSKETV